MARSAAQVLDRLVGRAVLAEADRVVRPDVGDRQLHERGQPDGAAHVVGEGEERAAVDAGAAVQRDAVHDRAHGVLADAEVQRAPVGAAGPHLGLPVGRQERRFALDRGVVALGEVGRAAPQLGQLRVEGGEHLAGGLAGGDALRVGVPGRAASRPSPRAGVRVVMPLQQRGAVGVALLPGVEPLLPGGVRLLAAVDDLAGVLDDLGRDVEGLLRVEAEDLLGGLDLVLAERRAVGGAGVLLVGRGPADDRPQHDERRAAGLGLGGGEARRRPRRGPRRRRRAARASRRPRSACATSSVKAMSVSSSIEIWLSS